MKRNRTLAIAANALNIFYALFILSFVSFIIIAIYWHVKPEAFNRVEISSGFKSGFGIPEIKILTGEKPAEGILLSELKAPMFYWLLIRNTAFFVLGLLILLRIKRVIRSIRSLHTFYEDNIQQFNSMGRLFLFVSLVNCFNFYKGENFHLELTIPFISLMAGIACYLLAEIFTEGKILAEDKKMIV